MKFKTTKRAILDGYLKIIEVGYCDLHYLLRFLPPIAYTYGISGWNADIYQMPFNANICICTGYRPFGNVHPDWQVIDRYNKQAKNCHTIEELMELLKQFVEEVKDGKK